MSSSEFRQPSDSLPPNIVQLRNDWQRHNAVRGFGEADAAGEVLLYPGRVSILASGAVVLPDGTAKAVRGPILQRSADVGLRSPTGMPEHVGIADIQVYDDAHPLDVPSVANRCAQLMVEALADAEIPHQAAVELFEGLVEFARIARPGSIVIHTSTSALARAAAEMLQRRPETNCELHVEVRWPTTPLCGRNAALRLAEAGHDCDSAVEEGPWSGTAWRSETDFRRWSEEVALAARRAFEFDDRAELELVTFSADAMISTGEPMLEPTRGYWRRSIVYVARLAD